jgi:Protein of unknown function (DUF2934)
MQPATQETSIRERAYAIWEQEGRPEGREWDHWLRAASELAGPHKPAVHTPPPLKSPRRSGSARRKSG